MHPVFTMSVRRAICWCSSKPSAPSWMPLRAGPRTQFANCARISSPLLTSVWTFTYMPCAPRSPSGPSPFARGAPPSPSRTPPFEPRAPSPSGRVQGFAAATPGPFCSVRRPCRVARRPGCSAHKARAGKRKAAGSGVSVRTGDVPSKTGGAPHATGGMPLRSARGPSGQVGGPVAPCGRSLRALRARGCAGRARPRSRCRSVAPSDGASRNHRRPA